MAVNIQGNQIVSTASKPSIDADYGPYTGSTLQEALNSAESALKYKKSEGKTIGIKVGTSSIIEYWYKFNNNNELSLTEKTPDLSSKQDIITNSNKLDADLVDDANSDNKFVTSSEKTIWNGKQNALTTEQLSNITKGGTALQPSSTSGLLKNDGTIDTETQSKAANAIQMPAGASANKVLGYENGNVAWVDKPSNGQDGADGVDGLSAFEIAQQQGYTGTVDQWLASLKANIGEFLFVPTDATAVSAMSSIGQTYSSAIDPLGKNVAPTQNTLSVILLMNDDATTPSKTMMIATQDDGNSGFEFVYAGDLQSAMPSNVLTENDIDDEPTAGSNNVVKSGGVFNKFSQLDQETTGSSITNPSVTETEGYFINGISGAVSSVSNYAYTTPFFAKAYDKIVVKANGMTDGSVAMIAKVITENSSYTPLVVSDGTTNHEYTWVVKEDGYYAASYYTLQSREITIYRNTPELLSLKISENVESIEGNSNDIKNLKTEIEIGLKSSASVPTYTVTEGKHILNTGAAGSLSNSSYTSLIRLNVGDVIYINCKTGANSTSVISQKMDSTVYKPLVLTEQDRNAHDYYWIADRVSDIALSFDNRYTPTIIRVTNSRLGNIETQLSNINELFDIKVSTPVYEVTTGKAIYSNGNVITVTGGSYTTPVLLQKGDCVVITGRFTTNLAAISLSDENGTQRVPKVIDSVGDIHTISYIVPITGYYIFSYYTDALFTCKVIKSRMNLFSLLSTTQTIMSYNDEVKTITVNEGNYVAYPTGFLPQNANYNYSNPIAVKKGDVVIMTGLCLNSGAAISLCSKYGRQNEENGANGVYVPVLQGQGNTVATYQYKVQQDGYISVSYNKNNIFQLSILSSEKLYEVLNIAEYDNDYLKNFFDSVICIGDSVTDGNIHDYPRTPSSSRGGIVRSASYPAYLTKMTGWEIENAGFSGYSPKMWWETKFGNYTYTNYQVTIIELGYNGGLTDTLDTDAPTNTPYTEYADTNTGDYCKIIEGILAVNPNMLIFVVKSPYMAQNNSDTTLSVIEQIAERYELPIINLTDSKYIALNAPDYHGKSQSTDTNLNLVHFNAVGYLAKAKLVLQQICDFVAKNISLVNSKKYFAT